MMPARTSGCVIASSTTTAPELEATLPAAMSLAAASSERASCMVGGVTDPLFDLYRYRGCHYDRTGYSCIAGEDAAPCEVKPRPRRSEGILHGAAAAAALVLEKP